MAVADSYLDILPLASMKAELRLQDASEMDTAIEGQINAAGSYVAARIAQPLISESGEWRMRGFPQEGAPLDIPVSHIYRVTGVSYWSISGSWRVAADGEIAALNLGRFETYTAGSHLGTRLYGPATGWPQTLDTGDAGSDAHPVRIGYLRGLDPVPEAIRQAMILTTRDYFEGHRAIPASGFAIDTLLMPFLPHAHPEILERLDRAAELR